MRGSGVGGLPQQRHPAPHKLLQRLPIKDRIDERGLSCLQPNSKHQPESQYCAYHALLEVRGVDPVVFFLLMRAEGDVWLFFI